MNDELPPIARPDTGMWPENRNKFSADELLRYAGEWVAWSADGATILDHGTDLRATMDRMRSSGRNPHEAVWESIPALGDEDALL
jgi:hypothetical protein